MFGEPASAGDTNFEVNLRDALCRSALDFGFASSRIRVHPCPVPRVRVLLLDANPGSNTVLSQVQRRSRDVLLGVGVARAQCSTKNPSRGAALLAPPGWPTYPLFWDVWGRSLHS